MMVNKKAVRGSRLFSESDDEFIRQHYTSDGAVYCALKLKFTPDQICGRAINQLGLKSGHKRSEPVRRLMLRTAAVRAKSVQHTGEDYEELFRDV